MEKIISISALLLFSSALHGMDQQNNVAQSAWRVNRVMVASVACAVVIGGLAPLILNPNASTAGIVVGSVGSVVWGAVAGYSINSYRDQQLGHVVPPANQFPNQVGPGVASPRALNGSQCCVSGKRTFQE